MKVRELIHLLKAHCKPEDVVILQSDPEGNGYGHLGVVFPVNKDGYSMKDDSADYTVKTDDCVVLMPVTNVMDYY